MLQIILDTVKRIEEKVEASEKRLAERMDKIGASVDYLEDDTPTIHEFDKLEHRVTKLEKRIAAN